jgi:polygalacturonase
MSGGVNNMYVSNCTFIGSDIGLRFKTTRGRGGMVENVFINNIVMKDIPAEAILFDMYYMAKDPVAISGEKREPPKVEFKPVNETTPQVQNFYIRNIVCNGAAKAIFVRGIPEMHVKNVWIENAMMQTNDGIDIQEASNISLNNITLFVKNTTPVVYILNSDSIKINKLTYNDSAAVLLYAQGERTKKIMLFNTNTTAAKQQLLTDFGATDAAVTWTEQAIMPSKKKKKSK